MIPQSDPASDIMERVLSFFGPDTPLRAAPEAGGQPYEERPQQKVMAETITSSLINHGCNCIEAPTGVGKSFAYLIPAIHYAHRTGKPVVIATHTIALQEQLINRDIPLLAKLLEVPFKAALAKGRGNYLCRRRLENLIANQPEYLPSNDLIPEIQRIANWAEDTTDGSRADLEFLPSEQSWSVICSEGGNCINEQKSSSGDCFFLKARRRLFSADLVVANHALLCTDLALRRDTDNAQSVLPDYDAVIIDEAHCLENAAATHLGVRVTTAGIRFIFNRLYNPKTNNGLLLKSGALRARAAATAARDQTERFLSRLTEWLNTQGRNPIQYTTPDQIPFNFEDSWVTVEDELNLLTEDDNYSQDFKNEIENLRLRLKDARGRIRDFISMALAGCVYWFESNDRNFRNIAFNIVPIEVDTILKEALFTDNRSVILTSATLAFNESLTHFKKRIGADHAESLILDSPFDFRTNVNLYIPHSEMPAPSDTDNFNTAAAEQIKRFIIQSRGKAFVLFTSYRMMYHVADLLDDFFRTNSITLLTQGKDLRRSKMLDIFREDKNSVIFGTDSFWMGVDVPGESLSNVIIVKLPFAVPSHPLIAARKAKIESDGGNSFQDYFLPEAVLKFRQGFGRLIRSRTDKGIIVVLDRRIVRSNYGKYFLESIPNCRHHIF